MPRYIVTLTEEEKQELKLLVQKGGKGYRIKHAQILLKLDQKPENKTWTYDRIRSFPQHNCRCCETIRNGGHGGSAWKERAEKPASESDW
jgi:hypothetical protein